MWGREHATGTHAWHLLWRGGLLFDRERPLIPVSPAWTADAAHRQEAS